MIFLNLKRYRLKMTQHGFYSNIQYLQRLANSSNYKFEYNFDGEIRETVPYLTFVYKTPTMTEVTVTSVGLEPPNFPDVIDLGPVTDWVSSLR
jgi:hypothetical protein